MVDLGPLASSEPAWDAAGPAGKRNRTIPLTARRKWQARSVCAASRPAGGFLSPRGPAAANSTSPSFWFFICCRPGFLVPTRCRGVERTRQWLFHRAGGGLSRELWKSARLGDERRSAIVESSRCRSAPARQSVAFAPPRSRSDRRSAPRRTKASRHEHAPARP